MKSKFALLAGAGAIAAAAATYALALTYNTHAHMQQVRGDSYTALPLGTRVAYVAGTSWQRFVMRANNVPHGDETALNRGTYGLPCLTPIAKP